VIHAPDLIVAELRSEARWRRLASTGAVALAFSALVLAARDRSDSPRDWATALALSVAGLAGAAASASRRSSLASAALAPACALAAALAVGGHGALAPGTGAECLATELVSGAVVVMATWVALRRGTSVLGARAAAAGAASGAVAGAAALQLTCPAHGALPHLLTFHVAGVALAALAAAAATTRARRRRPAPG
jgi:hypothetical protein